MQKRYGREVGCRPFPRPGNAARGGRRDLRAPAAESALTAPAAISPASEGVSAEQIQAGLSLQTRFLYRFSASVSRSGSAGGLRPRGRAGDGPDGDQARARLRGEGVALPDDLTIYDATYVALAAETATDSVRTGLLTCTLVWPRRANPGSVRARGDEA